MDTSNELIKCFASVNTSINSTLSAFESIEISLASSATTPAEKFLLKTLRTKFIPQLRSWQILFSQSHYDPSDKTIIPKCSHELRLILGFGRVVDYFYTVPSPFEQQLDSELDNLYLSARQALSNPVLARQ